MSKFVLNRNVESTFYDEIVIPKERKARVIPTGEMLDFLASKGPMFRQMWLKKFDKGMTLESLKYITALMKEDRHGKEENGNSSAESRTSEGIGDNGRLRSAEDGEGLQVLSRDGESSSSETLGKLEGEASDRDPSTIPPQN